MISRHTLWALLPVFILGCSNDSTTVQPPVPLTPDEQVVADCRAMRDVLENYAAAHGGSYGPAYGPPQFQFLDLRNPYTDDIQRVRFRAAYPGQIGLEWYLGCNGDLLGYRITGYGKDHMLIILESLDAVPANIRYVHDVTAANALLVLDAAQHWASAHNGHYPSDVSGDTNDDGKTLIEELPNGAYLINPDSDVKSEPQDGLGLAIAGAVGYLGADASGNGFIDSFNIEAYGCNGDIMLSLSSYSEGEDRVRIQSDRLRDAVETFAQSSGHYPHNLDSEETPEGKTAKDLYYAIPAVEFTKFANPYTGDNSFAFVGTAANRGEIAYQPIETAGVVTSYLITARGLTNEIIHAGPKT